MFSGTCTDAFLIILWHESITFITHCDVEHALQAAGNKLPSQTRRCIVLLSSEYGGAGNGSWAYRCCF